MDNYLDLFVETKQVADKKKTKLEEARERIAKEFNQLFKKRLKKEHRVIPDMTEIDRIIYLRDIINKMFTSRIEGDSLIGDDLKVFKEFELWINKKIKNFDIYSAIGTLFQMFFEFYTGKKAHSFSEDDYKFLMKFIELRMEFTEYVIGGYFRIR